MEEMVESVVGVDLGMCTGSWSESALLTALNSPFWPSSKACCHSLPGLRSVIYL